MKLRERGLKAYARARTRAAWAGQRILTLSAILAGLGLVLGVDKIRGLFVPPDITLVFADLRVAGVWFWIFGLTGLYVLALLAVWTKGDARASAETYPWIPASWHGWLTGPARALNRPVRVFLNLPIFRVDPTGRGLEMRFLFGLSVVLGAAWPPGCWTAPRWCWAPRSSGLAFGSSSATRWTTPARSRRPACARPWWGDEGCSSASPAA